MRIIKVDDYHSLSIQAAGYIAHQVRQNPYSVLGLATGSTPMGCYQELVRQHHEEGLDFQHVTTFNLDEYYGLQADNPNSYHYYMNAYFFDHINIDKSKTHVPNGVTTDVAAECLAYDRLALESGGMDILILGLGSTGHIAFNEPDTVFHPETRLVDLNKSTLEDNGHYFKREESVPRQAISVGVRFILNSRVILLLVSSDKKAVALERALYGPVDPQVPASILQLHHNVIVIADEAALSKCPMSV